MYKIESLFVTPEDSSYPIEKSYPIEEDCDTILRDIEVEKSRFSERLTKTLREAADRMVGNAGVKAKSLIDRIVKRLDFDLEISEQFNREADINFLMIALGVQSIPPSSSSAERRPYSIDDDFSHVACFIEAEKRELSEKLMGILKPAADRMVGNEGVKAIPVIEKIMNKLWFNNEARNKFAAEVSYNLGEKCNDNVAIEFLDKNWLLQEGSVILELSLILSDLGMYSESLKIARYFDFIDDNFQLRTDFLKVFAMDVRSGKRNQKAKEGILEAVKQYRDVLHYRITETLDQMLLAIAGDEFKKQNFPEALKINSLVINKKNPRFKDLQNDLEFIQLIGAFSEKPIVRVKYGAAH